MLSCVVVGEYMWVVSYQENELFDVLEFSRETCVFTYTPASVSDGMKRLRMEYVRENHTPKSSSVEERIFLHTDVYSYLYRLQTSPVLNVWMNIVNLIGKLFFSFSKDFNEITQCEIPLVEKDQKKKKQKNANK